MKINGGEAGIRTPTSLSALYYNGYEIASV